MARYTKEQEAHIVKTYTADPVKKTVEALAEELNFPARSIIAKLSSLGVYQKKKYTSKTGEPPIKKAALADDLGNICCLHDFEVEQLEKLSKPLLKKLIELYSRKLESDPKLQNFNQLTSDPKLQNFNQLISDPKLAHYQELQQLVEQND